MINRLEYILKHNRIIQFFYVLIFSLLFRFISIFIKVDRKQILFQSLIGKNYGDSPKVLYDAIKSDKRFKDFKFVWAFDEPSRFSVDNDIKTVKLTSLQYYIEALRSGFWICNVSIERGLKFKPQKTFYLNTGHGIPIKFTGNAQKERNDYDYSTIDFMCASSEYDKAILIRDLKIREDTFCICGMPRNDELYIYNPDDKIKIKKEFNIPQNKKIILYAPTWRDSENMGNSYQIAPPINFNKWKEELSDEYVIFVRAHHLTTQLIGIEFDNFVINVSNYMKLNKLLIASDILITDYSAIFFDYAILEKPIILFPYDLEKFEKDRGLYSKLDTFVSKENIFYKEDDIVRYIKEMDYSLECEKVAYIKNKYMPAEGCATRKCIEALLKNIKENKDTDI